MTTHPIVWNMADAIFRQRSQLKRLAILQERIHRDTMESASIIADMRLEMNVTTHSRRRRIMREADRLEASIARATRPDPVDDAITVGRAETETSWPDPSY